MAYFICIKNSPNVNNSLYRIAENQSDLNNLNIIQLDYNIIQDTQSNFESVKYITKYFVNYNDSNIITYQDSDFDFYNKKSLDLYIENIKINIDIFLKNNKNHPLFQKWSDYYTQLSNLNTENISYPLNGSLEKYFNSLGQASLNPLQLP
jgi:hypothetical protein